MNKKKKDFQTITKYQYDKLQEKDIENYLTNHFQTLIDTNFLPTFSLHAQKRFSQRRILQECKKDPILTTLEDYKLIRVSYVYKKKKHVDTKVIIRSKNPIYRNKLYVYLVCSVKKNLIVSCIIAKKDKYKTKKENS